MCFPCTAFAGPQPVGAVPQDPQQPEQPAEVNGHGQSDHEGGEREVLEHAP